MTKNLQFKADKKRLLILTLCLLTLFSLLILQFYHVQVIQEDKWKKRAESQHYFTVKEAFRRGTFYSNTFIERGHPESPQAFAVDIPKYHLYVDPKGIPVNERDFISEKLIEIVNLSSDKEDEFREQFEKKSRSRRLVRWLSPKTRQKILQWWQPYIRKKKIPANAIYFVKDYLRSYPFGKLAGQVLHTIRDLKDEETLQAIPTGGLELYFNSDLKGEQGLRRLLRSPRNYFELGNLVKEPKDGADIYLTINHNLQTIAEEELKRAVEISEAKGGWAVMMEPHSGEIWALAQYPFFFPPNYQEYFNNLERIEETKVRAVSDMYEPGSTLKPLTLAIALQANQILQARGEEALFTPEEQIDISNGFFPGRRTEIKDVRRYKYMNMYHALQKSSNIYVGRLIQRVVERLGSEWYRSILVDTLGFGFKTGIELPAESSGLVPKPGRYHPNGKLEWSVPTPYSLAMGYNIQVNSIQALKAFAIVANGGYQVQPTLVRGIDRKDGRGLESNRRNKCALRQNEPLLQPEVIRELRKALLYASEGRYSELGAYSAAGKSGTSRKVEGGVYTRKKHRASYIGYAPAYNPRFVMIVLIDEPKVGFIPGVGYRHHGGTAAAPVFRRIARRSLEYLGVEPDKVPGSPARDVERASWLQEVERLNQLFKDWNTESAI
ncbi:MAG: penicillin-binding protein [Waddliaceae bacterium]|nr:penicillin-binding protein [Waddliaceae bacterium]